MKLVNEMSTERERSSRIQTLAETILKASEAMAQSDWAACQRLLGEASRMSRVLGLLDKEESNQRE